MSPNPTSKQVTRRLVVGALALAATVATAATSAHADKKKRPPTVAEQVEARLYDLLTTIEYTAPTRFVFHLANDFLVDPKPGTELNEPEVGFWAIKAKATARRSSTPPTSAGPSRAATRPAPRSPGRTASTG